MLVSTAALLDYCTDWTPLRKRALLRNSRRLFAQPPVGSGR